MSQIFISHVEEDEAIARALASGLRDAGYRTWYYEDYSLPGLSYVDQIVQAIGASAAVVVILSTHALRSQQIELEIVQAHESDKNFMPLLSGLTHEEFRTQRPDWRAMMGATVAVTLPHPTAEVVPRVVSGLRRLGIEPQPPGSSESTPPLRAAPGSASPMQPADADAARVAAPARSIPAQPATLQEQPEPTQTAPAKRRALRKYAPVAMGGLGLIFLAAYVLGNVGSESEPPPAGSESDPPPAGSESEPPAECVVVLEADTDSGPLPLTVHFSAETDCTSSVVTFHWDFGDGTEARGNEPNPTHIYRTDGDYAAHVTAIGADGAEATDAIDISVEPESEPEPEGEPEPE